MKAAITLAALLCTAAHAFEPPAAIGLHIASHHTEARETGSWNNRNAGLYARWESGLVVGTLRNSERRQSAYVGRVFQTERWHGLGADLTLGAITGYRRAVSPLAAASVSMAVTDALAARLSYLPKAAPKASAAVHLSLEWSLQ